MSVKLIVGLGNPGSKYTWTRHNAGFMVLDALSHAHGIAVTRKSFSGLMGEGSFGGRQLVLLKPQTFMNLSGRSVQEAMQFYKISGSGLLVIHDDLDIPFGKVKLKDGGGHGGHNGLRSLQQHLGGGQFARLRIGVGRPVHGDAADYVLSSFSKEELGDLPRLLDELCGLVELVVAEGLPKAMSLFNNRDLLLT